MLGKICVVTLVIVGSACTESNAVQCGFGLCPPGSQCDDANSQCIPPGCGDGVVAGTEKCDGSASIDPTVVDCTDFGYYVPTGLACSPECTFDTTQCTGGKCGDRMTNGPELCDGIPPTGAVCADFGFQLGRLGCTVDCAPNFSNCSSLGWQHAHGNAPDELHAVWGSGQAAMFAVGRGGHIMQGNGTVWVEMASPTTQDLDGIWGNGKNNVFAVGAGGTILHYDGTSWKVVASGTTQNLHAINGTSTSPPDIWAVGDNGTILHTVGQSGTWTAETSGVTVSLQGVWAYDVAAPVAVGDAATTGSAAPTALVRSGTTWTAMTTPVIQVPIGTTATLSAVWGQNQGYVAVGSASIATTPARGSVLQVNTAAGSTWGFTGQSITSSDLRSVWGVVTNRTDIYIGGLAGALIHYNGKPGPTSFYAYDSGTTRAIRGLWGLGPAFVRAATLGGEIQEYTGTDLATTNLGGVPGKNLDAVWADTTNGIAIAAGDGGVVVRHDNTGWLPPTTLGLATAPWNAVWGSGTTVAMAGGTNGTGGFQGIVVSANDGASFGGAALATVVWRGLWGTSPNDIYAVGNNGALAHYNGTWTQLANISTRDLFGIWGSSDTDIFAVGTLGTIVHYDGASWTAQTSNVTNNLTSVWGTGPTDVFAAGGAGTILHYDGTTWRRMTSGTGQDLSIVTGTSHADVFVGGRGTVLHWNGVQWSPMGVDIEDIFGAFVDAGFSYFVGNVAAVNNLTNAGALVLGRTPLTAENCATPWDDDGDGLLNCADSDCTDPVLNVACTAGGVCGPTVPIACGETTTGASTYTGIARIDDLPCLDHATPGPEASYRLVADHDGTISVTLDDPNAELDLVQLDPYDPSSVADKRRIACDVGHCTAAPPASGTRTLTFAAKAGEMYYLLVDGPANTADDFTLSVSCP